MFEGSDPQENGVTSDIASTVASDDPPSNTIIDVIDELLAEGSPVVAAMQLYFNLPCSNIPRASKPFPHQLKKLPSLGDGALHFIDGDGSVAEVWLIACINNETSDHGSKYGIYLDMYTNEVVSSIYIKAYSF